MPGTGSPSSRFHAGELQQLVIADADDVADGDRTLEAFEWGADEAVLVGLEAVDADVDAVVAHGLSSMQAAPTSAIRSMLTAGSSDKIIFCFTHFDAVAGDNLGANASSRARHVLASAENLLSSIRDEFNPRSERALRRRLDGNRVFLGSLDKPLDTTTPQGKQAVQQLVRLLDMVDRVNERPDLGEARPVYDKTNLVLAVAAAAMAFHRRWKALLGVAPVPDVDREHWTRVRALNRRFAEGTADQYDTLRPAADLREYLKDEIYKTLEMPLRWEGGRPDDDVQVTAVINEFSQAIAKRLTGPIRERLSIRAQRSWQQSYALSGTGSTFVRARRISDEILSANVPVPGSVPSPDQNDFLHGVIAVVEDAAEEVGCKLT